MHDHRVRKTLVNLWKLKRIQGIFNEFVKNSSSTIHNRCYNDKIRGGNCCMIISKNMISFLEQDSNLNSIL